MCLVNHNLAQWACKIILRIAQILEVWIQHWSRRSGSTSDSMVSLFPSFILCMFCNILSLFMLGKSSTRALTKSKYTHTRLMQSPGRQQCWWCPGKKVERLSDLPSSLPYWGPCKTSHGYTLVCRCITQLLWSINLKFEIKANLSTMWYEEPLSLRCSKYHFGQYHLLQELSQIILVPFTRPGEGFLSSMIGVPTFSWRFSCV